MYHATIMIHVIVTATIKPGCLDEYLSIARQLGLLVNKEPGCIRYVYTTDTNSPLSIQDEINNDQVTLIEEWESIDALKVHLTAPHLKEFGNQMAPLRISATARVTKTI